MQAKKPSHFNLGKPARRFAPVLSRASNAQSPTVKEPAYWAGAEGRKRDSGKLRLDKGIIQD
jgi:hypothetical protein